MRLKKTFALTFAFFLTLWASAETAPSRIEKINQQIEELEEMKRGYEARALRHQNQAERLQFDDEAFLETRRHNQLADENREKATLIQKEIDRLKAEREQLMRRQ